MVVKDSQAITIIYNPLDHMIHKDQYKTKIIFNK